MALRTLYNFTVVVYFQEDLVQENTVYSTTFILFPIFPRTYTYLSIRYIIYGTPWNCIFFQRQLNDLIVYKNRIRTVKTIFFFTHFNTYMYIDLCIDIIHVQTHRSNFLCTPKAFSSPFPFPTRCNIIGNTIHPYKPLHTSNLSLHCTVTI